jgi:cytidylate kinase
MKIDLKKYMEDRDRVRDLQKDPGPVLTISREYGCEANDITVKLLARINRLLDTKSVNATHWRYISKEIIEESARELKLTPERLEHRVVHHTVGGLDDMFSSFSNSYNLSDTKIIDKVKELIHTYASEGRVIFIGRGGAMMTRAIPKSVHVRLYAPFAWRATMVAQKHKLSQMEAEELVRSMDNQRTLWTEHLTGKTFDTSIFDMMLNRSTLSIGEIVDTIFSLMQKRALI